MASKEVTLEHRVLFRYDKQTNKQTSKQANVHLGLVRVDSDSLVCSQEVLTRPSRSMCRTPPPPPPLRSVCSVSAHDPPPPPRNVCSVSAHDPTLPLPLPAACVVWVRMIPPPRNVCSVSAHDPPSPPRCM